MSEHKMVTEREAVQREREAFAKGARQAHDDQYHARMHQKDCGMYRYDYREGMRTAHDDAWRAVMMAAAAEQAAQRLYPMPKVTRPRTLEVNGLSYRYINSELSERAPGRDRWYPVGNVPVHSVPKMAELMANPTEEVDADADA